jgi:hypothetical protein
METKHTTYDPSKLTGYTWPSVMMPARGPGMNPPIGSSTKHRDPIPSVFGTKKEILVANPPYIIIVKNGIQ